MMHVQSTEFNRLMIELLDQTSASWCSSHLLSSSNCIPTSKIVQNWLTIVQVGTVLNAKDAKTAINAGAKFLMSPVIVKACSWNLELLLFLNMLNDHQEIMDDVQGGEVLYIPGAMTPTEVRTSM